MKFTVYQGSRQGSRKNNQDRVAYSYSREAMLAVLADGMGGHGGGEIAAQIVINTLMEAFQHTAMPYLPDPFQFLSETILLAHEAIENYATSHGLPECPRTTVVAAIAQRNVLHVAHVGDSRLYHFRDGMVLKRTEDHSKVQLMYRRGLLNLGQLGTHPERNKIYNCLGGNVKPEIELSTKLELHEGDTILLCSDGLWSLVGDEKMAEILSGELVNMTVPKLLDLAESRADAKSDNMSAIALNWGGRASPRLQVSTNAMPFASTTTILMKPHQDAAGDAPIDEAKMSDVEIEGAIAEIQNAIKKLQK